MLYTFGDITFDAARNTLTRAGVESVLPPKTTDLLKLLIDRRGTVITRDEIFETLWPDAVVSDAALWFQISKAREALASNADYIKTVPRRGYAWESPQVQLVSASPLEAPVPRQHGAGALIGRNEQIEELRRRLRLVQSGECHFVLISGEAGSGKSRLLEEAVMEASAAGLRTYRGQFMPAARGLPYQPFCDVLTEHFRSPGASGKRSGTDFSDIAAPLLALFPALSELPELRAAAEKSVAGGIARQTDTAGDRLAVYDLFARALARIAQSKPRVFLFEDIQESEDGLDALQYIVRRLAPTGTLILASAQIDVVTRDHPLHAFLDDFRHERRFTHIRLGPLSLDETRAYMRSLNENELPSEDLVARCHATTGGNPMFIREVYLALQQAESTMAAGVSDDTTALTIFALDHLPRTLEQAVERRLQSLPAAHRQLLSVASVIGTEIHPQDLTPFVQDEIEVEETLETLARGRLLVEDPASRQLCYRFSNPIFAGVLYSALSRSRRREIHRRYAELLELKHSATSDPQILSALLHHYDRADVAEKVADYGLKLAERALGTWATTEAARAARTVLDHTRGVAGFELAAGRAHLVLSRARRVKWEWTAALDEIREAIDCFEKAGDEAAACTAMTAAAEMSWEAHRVREADLWLTRALDRTRQGDYQGELARLLRLGALMANLQADSLSASRFEEELGKIDKPGSASATAPPTGIKTAGISLPISAPLADIDPSLVFTIAQGEVIPLVFEPLTRPGADGRIVPWLAEDFHAEDDGRAFVFRLRHDARFHDGRVVTSADVRYSFVRLLRSESSRSRWLLAPIKGAADLMAGKSVDLPGFKINSPREFRIELERAIVFFPALTAHVATSIVPEGTDRFTASWKEGTIGTGPYRVISFEAERTMVTEANPFYWRRGLPHIDRVFLTFDVNPKEAAIGLKDGRFSVAPNLPPAEIFSLRSVPGLADRFQEAPSLSTYYIAFNINRGPFVDPAARRAAVDALDPTELVRKHLGGLAQPARTMIPPELLGDAPGSPKQDTHSAQRSSLPRTKITGILNPAFETTYQEFADGAVSALGKVNFEVEILKLPKAEYYEALRNGSADFVLTAWAADYPDPDNFAYGLFHSREGIVGRFCGTEELDGMIERGRSEADGNVRRWIYRQFEAELREQAAALPLFHRTSCCFVQEGLSGVRLCYFAPFLAYEELSAG